MYCTCCCASEEVVNVEVPPDKSVEALPVLPVLDERVHYMQAHQRGGADQSHIRRGLSGVRTCFNTYIC